MAIVKTQEIIDYEKRVIQAITPTIGRCLEEMKEILILKYGEENVQIQSPLQVAQDYAKSTGINLSNFLTVIDIRVIIKYPEIEIKNSRGSKRIIRDLYVAQTFRVRDNNLYATSFTGCRGVVTANERSVGYAHSHLPVYTVRFENFCTGVGPINITLAKLQQGYNKDMFRMHLQNIHAYVRWESLDGVPYIKMSEVTAERSETDGIVPLSYYIHTLSANNFPYVAKLISTQADIKNLLEFNYFNNNVQVKLTEELEFLIANKISENSHLSNDLKNRLLCVKIDNEFKTYRFDISRNDRTRINDPNEFLLTFKGEEVRRKIFKNETTQIEKEKIKFYVHPEFKKYIEQELSNHFTASALKYSRTLRESTSVDNSKA